MAKINARSFAGDVRAFGIVLPVAYSDEKKELTIGCSLELARALIKMLPEEGAGKEAGSEEKREAREDVAELEEKPQVRMGKETRKAAQKILDGLPEEEKEEEEQEEEGANGKVRADHVLKMGRMKMAGDIVSVLHAAGFETVDAMVAEAIRVKDQVPVLRAIADNTRIDQRLRVAAMNHPQFSTDDCL